MADHHATLILGDAADMACVADGEAALVVTSPPYFPPGEEAAFAAPRRCQSDVAGTWSRIESFARCLAPAFREMARVVGKSGLCCIETKDVTFGDFRLPLAALHAALARDAGLWVRSSLLVRCSGIKPAHLPNFVRRPVPGTFRALDASTLLICSHLDWKPRPGRPLDIDAAEALRLTDPCWRLAPATVDRIHEHQSAPDLVRRLVSLLSFPGDLVVDPFAGSAQALRIARELGRRSIGYERDHGRFERAIVALAGSGSAHSRKRGPVGGS